MSVTTEFKKEGEFLLRFVEHLQIKYSHYILQGNSPDADVIYWIITDVYKDLKEPRGRTGLSYEKAMEKI